MGDRAFFFDEELLMSRVAGELTLGADGQSYDVVVVGILILGYLESH